VRNFNQCYFARISLSFQIGGRYYAVTPTNGPRWGARFAVVFLFPA
jgi:hypothetical protein